MDKARILLVDDHEAVRTGLRTLLNSEPDMEVVAESADGRSAIADAVRSQPDVVVMDISMPGDNGLDTTTRLLRAIPQTRIVTFTRHEDDAFVKMLMRAGASAYVLKQSRVSELIHAIRVVAKGHTYLDPAVTARAFAGVPRPVRAAMPKLPDLSPREEQVLRLVAWGYSNKEIAARLDVSVKTVETHKANASLKQRLTGRNDIVRFALLQGWLRDT